MATKVDIAPPFGRALRQLGRKYPRVVDEVDGLMAQLEEGARPGDQIPNVGFDVYKVRLRNPSASNGKSGGFRVIYYVYLAEHVILLTIYSKSQKRTSAWNKFGALSPIIRPKRRKLTKMANLNNFSESRIRIHLTPNPSPPGGEGLNIAGFLPLSMQWRGGRG